jgi:hypothetical protein
MFKGSMTDVCWSSDGLRLAMSSQDGSVAIVEFSEAEIGRPIPDAAFFSILERAYGMEAAQKFAENRARARALSRRSSESRTLSFTSGSEAQKESVDAKGRRRITPVSLTGAGFGQGAELQGQAPKLPPPPPPPQQQQQQQQQQQPRTSHHDSASAASAQPTQAPLQIKRKSDASESAASKRAVASQQQQQQHHHHHHHHQQQQQHHHHQQQQQGNAFATSHSSPHVESATGSAAAAASSLQSRLGATVGFSQAPDAPIQLKTVQARAPATGGSMPLALDAAEYTATTRLQGCGAVPTVISFIKATSAASAAATLSRGSNVIWRQVLPANASCCSGVDSAFSVVVCCDASLHAFAPDGERISLPMRVEMPVARVMTRAHLGLFYVMVLSCSGRFKLWDLKQQRCLCSGDIEPFIGPHSLSRNIDVQLLSTGVPLVIVGSSAWAYHCPMQSWTCVCDSSTSAIQLHPAAPSTNPSVLEAIEIACGSPLPAPPVSSSLSAVGDYMQVMLQRLQVLFKSHSRIHLSCPLFPPQTSNRRSSLAIHQAAACLRDIDSVQVVVSVCRTRTVQHSNFCCTELLCSRVQFCVGFRLQGLHQRPAKCRYAPNCISRRLCFSLSIRIFSEVGFKWPFLTPPSTHVPPFFGFASQLLRAQEFCR